MVWVSETSTRQRARASQRRWGTAVASSGKSWSTSETPGHTRAPLGAGWGGVGWGGSEPGPRSSWDNKPNFHKGASGSGQTDAAPPLRGATINLKGSTNPRPPQPTYFENLTSLGAAPLSATRSADGSRAPNHPRKNASLRQIQWSFRRPRRQRPQSGSETEASEATHRTPQAQRKTSALSRAQGRAIH
jgi:hypothetical protein